MQTEIHNSSTEIFSYKEFVSSSYSAPQVSVIPFPRHMDFHLSPRAKWAEWRRAKKREWVHKISEKEKETTVAYWKGAETFEKTCISALVVAGSLAIYKQANCSLLFPLFPFSIAAVAGLYFPLGVIAVTSSAPLIVQYKDVIVAGAEQFTVSCAKVGAGSLPLFTGLVAVKTLENHILKVPSHASPVIQQVIRLAASIAITGVVDICVSSLVNSSLPGIGSSFIFGGIASLAMRFFKTCRISFVKRFGF